MENGDTDLMTSAVGINTSTALFKGWLVRAIRLGRGISEELDLHHTRVYSNSKALAWQFF